MEQERYEWVGREEGGGRGPRHQRFSEGWLD